MPSSREVLPRREARGVRDASAISYKWNWVKMMTMIMVPLMMVPLMMVVGMKMEAPRAPGAIESPVVYDSEGLEVSPRDAGACTSGTPTRMRY